jgi:uncharacterized protein YggE
LTARRDGAGSILVCIAICFELSDPQAALDQARQEAWNEAPHKTEQWSVSAFTAKNPALARS